MRSLRLKPHSDSGTIEVSVSFVDKKWAGSHKMRTEMAILAWSGQRNWNDSRRTHLQLASLNFRIQAQLPKGSKEYERRSAIYKDKENQEQINEKKAASSLLLPIFFDWD
jgi:hypothetical protein